VWRRIIQGKEVVLDAEDFHNLVRIDVPGVIFFYVTASEVESQTATIQAKLNNCVPIEGIQKARCAVVRRPYEMDIYRKWLVK
jgi:hypothetical protein